MSTRVELGVGRWVEAGVDGAMYLSATPPYYASGAWTPDDLAALRLLRDQVIVVPVPHPSGAWSNPVDFRVTAVRVGPGGPAVDAVNPTGSRRTFPVRRGKLVL